jgi:protein-tyrosine phosphatase
MAEAVLRTQLARAGLDKQVEVDSAGTGDWHVGDRMDRKARTELRRSGYNGESHRARQLDRSWLAERDLILAMDAANLRDLRALAPRGEADRIRLFGAVGGLGGVDVPDPYYGDQADFARILTMLETGMQHLVELIQADPQITNPAA